MNQSFWGKPLAFILGISLPMISWSVDSDTDDVGDNLENLYGTDPLNLASTPILSASLLHSIYGSENEQLGMSLSALGDINKDGYTDFAIGNSLVGTGSVKIISGEDWSTLHELTGTTDGDKFGAHISSAGDANKDGYPDIIISTANGSNNGSRAGEFHIISGQNGSTIRTVLGNGEDAFLGNTVSGAGDVNNDGYDDQIVSSFRTSNNVQVYSGENGSILYEYTLSDISEIQVSSAGDYNNDGHDDFIMSNPRVNDGNGTIHVISGKDGELLLFTGGSDGANFGSSLAALGDINDDNHDDILVGARYANSNGEVYVISGADNQVLYTFQGENINDSFGDNVNTAGDINGDGINDIFVGAYIANKAYVYSGASGDLLFDVEGETSELLGINVAGAGDLNGDQINDLIIGANGNDEFGNNNGVIRIYTLNVPDLDSDGDGLSNEDESTIHGTSPNLVDTDNDFIPDGDEIAQGTDPLNPEADVIVGFEGGLMPLNLTTFNVNSKDNPGWEVTDSEASVGTYSLKAKTVGAFEFNSITFATYFSGTSNLVFDYKVESTFGIDGLALYIDQQDTGWRAGGDTGWQTYNQPISAGIHIISIVYGQNGTNPTGRNTAWIDNIRFTQARFLPTDDMDGDGLNNAEEQANNTSLIIEDTDGDSLSDGDEVNILNTNPTNEDSDNDGLRDDIEYEVGTDPLDPDGDGDGYFDGTEVDAGTSPFESSDRPSGEPDIEDAPNGNQNDNGNTGNSKLAEGGSGGGAVYYIMLLGLALTFRRTRYSH